jgi:hypothetical protein
MAGPDSNKTAETGSRVLTSASFSELVSAFTPIDLSYSGIIEKTSPKIF